MSLRLVFAGTPAAALPSLDALAASPHEIVAVLTRPDAPTGRGRRLEPSPVKARAEELGLPVLTPQSARDPHLYAELQRLAPDACPVVAYGELLTQKFLDIPRLGWINLHFSLLPAWRGAAPVQHAVLAGDEFTGASTFRLERGMDTGPVFGVMTERIRATDTSGDLLARLAEGGAGLLLATLDGLASGELTAQPQSSEGVSYAPKIDVPDVQIDWTRPALALDRLIRAANPAPGAWTVRAGQRFKILSLANAAAPQPHSPDVAANDGDQAKTLRPGELVVTKRAVWVGTGTSPVELGVVQAHGKKALPAADWTRGIRTESGETLGGPLND